MMSMSSCFSMACLKPREPDLQMVPRFSSISSLLMPMPLSDTVRVRSASLRVTVMANWSREMPTLSSVRAV